jgi:ferredoxin
LFGTIVGQRKGEWHYMAGVDRKTFADLHLDIYQTLKPVLTILDGVWAMEGNGPSNGRPRKLGLIAAAEDAVALDVCICHLLGASLRSFPLYRAAQKRGIGETDINQMQFPLDQPDSFIIRDFEIPTRDSLGVLPEWLGWVTKRFLVSKPAHHTAACTACGQCQAICPTKAITLIAKSIRFDYHTCIRCFCCQEVCPQDAIQFQQGLLVKLLKYFGK